jgi:ubiquinone/menaquinone biosynthesis C-methylase UbiE
MAGTDRIRIMSNFGFRVMTWAYRFMGFFSSPRKRLSLVPMGPGMIVVDYACGPGRYTMETARRVGPVGRVIAVDIHPLAIKTVKDKAARLNLPNIDTILLDSYDTGIADSTADLILCLDAFHMIGDRPALLREIHRILKPDGVFYIEPGHMKLSAARDAIIDSGRFRLTGTWGHDLQFAPIHDA